MFLAELITLFLVGEDDARPIDGTYLTIGDSRDHIVSALSAEGLQNIQFAKLSREA